MSGGASVELFEFPLCEGVETVTLDLEPRFGHINKYRSLCCKSHAS